VLWVTHNLQEALRLADRVLVLSESPGRLLADLHVDLLRPRSDTSGAFAGKLEILRALLGRQIVQEAAA